jgi:hypothetical protein
MTSPGVARVRPAPSAPCPRRHRLFKFEGDVEMLDDPGLAAPGDEDHLLDPRLARFVHRILDQRAIDDRQQFLGDGLGRGKEPGAQPGDGKHGFADRVFSDIGVLLVGQVAAAFCCAVPRPVAHVNHRWRVRGVRTKLAAGQIR